ncbi:hypothetical protein EDF78_106158 [Rahnella sp. BIGb0236]|nr:hypothetical protein EDF78_106158 [Rahnella sp. BIGb0236]
MLIITMLTRVSVSSIIPPKIRQGGETGRSRRRRGIRANARKFVLRSVMQSNLTACKNVTFLQSMFQRRTLEKVINYTL